MNYPRYFVEIDRATREILATHVITYSAILEAGQQLTSVSIDREMLELSEKQIKEVSGFPDIVGTHRLDADNKLAEIAG